MPVKYTDTLGRIPTTRGVSVCEGQVSERERVRACYEGGTLPGKENTISYTKLLEKNVFTLNVSCSFHVKPFPFYIFRSTCYSTVVTELTCFYFSINITVIHIAIHSQLFFSCSVRADLKQSKSLLPLSSPSNPVPPVFNNNYLNSIPFAPIFYHRETSTMACQRCGPLFNDTDYFAPSTFTAAKPIFGFNYCQVDPLYFPTSAMSSVGNMERNITPPMTAKQVDQQVEQRRRNSKIIRG